MAANNNGPAPLQWTNDPALNAESNFRARWMMQAIWSLRDQQNLTTNNFASFNSNFNQSVTDIVSSAIAANSNNASATKPVIFGTHANRLTLLPSTYSGYLYIETDRFQACYYSNGSFWILVEATAIGSFENRYANFNAFDAGFEWIETSRNNQNGQSPYPLYRWDGQNWDFISGAFYRNQNAVSTLSATLGANDVGAIVNVVDFAGQLQWTGNGLGWGPEDCGMHGMGPIFAEVDPTGNGWHLYDGSNNVSYLQANGNVGTVNLPNLSGNNASGNTFTAAGTTNGNINAPVAPTVSLNSTNANFTTLVSGNEALTAVSVANVSNNGVPQSIVRRAWFRR